MLRDATVNPQLSPMLGQFGLVQPLKYGGMSEVWLGRAAGAGQPVAIKLLHPPSDANISVDRLELALQQEIRAIAALDHPYIVSILDWGQLEAPLELHALERPPLRLSAGSPYLVMEYAAGGSLEELNHDLSWPQIRAILLKLLEALAHAHAREVIHRDLKPGNVLLKAGKGSVEDILLGDFGLAYELEHTQDERAKHVLGTPSYMAPEQITNDWREQGPWTDLYALGCLAWWLLHGSPPFTGKDVLQSHLHELPPRLEPRMAVPDRLNGWLRTLLAKSPRDRFRFAAEAARELLRMDSLSSAAPSLRGWGERARATQTSQRVERGLGLVELQPAPFVGRKAERQLMWQRFEEVISRRQPQVLLLEGKPGVGKTRLAQWLAHRASELGFAMTMRSGHQPDQAPGEAIGRMLRHYMRCADLDLAQLTTRTKQAVRRLARREDTPEQLAQDIDLLVQLMHQPSSPLLDELHAYEVMSRHLVRVASYRPFIIWMDDVHCGEHSLNFLLYLLELQPKAPLLFVLTADETPKFQSDAARQALALLKAQERCVTLNIEPLDPISHSALIQHLLPMAAPLAREVERRAEGNPLFTIQLISDLVARDALVKQPEGWTLREGLEVELPDDTEQLFTARLEQLLAHYDEEARPQAQRALELAACLGQEVLFDEWFATCEAAQVQLPAGLIEQASLFRLVRWSEVGWCFDHVMIRDCLLGLAKRHGRAQGHHGACASMLKAYHGEGQGHIAERLAHHLIEAGHPASALDSLLLAMESRRIHGEFSHGEALYAQWRFWMERVAAEQPHDRRWSRGELAYARLLLTQGDLELARALIDGAVARAQLIDDASLVAEGHLLRAWSLRKAGALEQTGVELERARQRFERVADDEGLGRCLVALGELYVTLGRYKEAQALLTRSVSLLERHHNTHELGRAFVVLSELAYGQLDEYHGDVFIERALAQFQREGNRIALAQAYNFQGEVARRAGELERASAHYRRALAMMRTTASQEVVVPCLNLLFTMLERREYAQAAQLIPSVWREMERVGWFAYESCLRLGQLCCQAARGQWQGWPEEMARVEQVLATHGLVDADVALLCEHAAQLALGAGERALARPCLTLAIAQRRQLQQEALAHALTLQLKQLDAP